MDNQTSGPFYSQGRYLCKILSQSMGESSKGNPQFVMRFRVVAHPNPDTPGEWEELRQQYERTFYRSITEKSMPLFMDDLRMLGFEGKFSFTLFDPSTEDAIDFAGIEIEMFCSHETWEGKTREKWAIPRDNRVPSGVEAKPLPKSKLRELDALYGKHLKGAAAAKPAPAKKTSNHQPVAVGGPAEVDDSDVPF